MWMPTAVRRSAWESYADAHLAARNTMASCLAAGVKQDVFTARARRYGSSLEAALTPNEIPLEVFHSLIATCRLHRIDPYDYLVDVLPRVGHHPAERVRELTPRLWKQLFAAHPPCAPLHRRGT